MVTSLSPATQTAEGAQEIIFHVLGHQSVLLSDQRLLEDDFEQVVAALGLELFDLGRRSEKGGADELAFLTSSILAI